MSMSLNWYCPQALEGDRVLFKNRENILGEAALAHSVGTSDTLEWAQLPGGWHTRLRIHEMQSPAPWKIWVGRELLQYRRELKSWGQLQYPIESPPSECTKSWRALMFNKRSGEEIRRHKAIFNKYLVNENKWNLARETENKPGESSIRETTIVFGGRGRLRLVNDSSIKVGQGP